MTLDASTEPTQTPVSSTLLPGITVYRKALQLVIAGIMACLLLWIVSGAALLLESLYHGITDGHWHQATEEMIIKVVMLLATLELIRTLQSYLEIGRVKVTFILDAALVVLIGELISLWYREYTLHEVVLSLTVIVVLTVLRITTVKFSPENTV
ncbi:MAG: phosphate-starvation-inducible PsiE family protein [Candidatus Thiodiazotropha sp.]